MNNQIGLTYSEIIYLFADKAISERSKFLNYDHHPSGEKISFKPLSYMMVTAALTYLEDNGYISLTIKEVKKLIFLSGKEVFGKKLKETDAHVTGIEKVLLGNFNTEKEIHKAVYWLLNDDYSSPWGQIVAISKKSLAEKGYLTLEKERKNIFTPKQYLFGDKKIQDIIPAYEEVKNQISQFSLKTEVFKLIDKSVKNSINARIEHNSSDD